MKPIDISKFQKTLTDISVTMAQITEIIIKNPQT